MRIRRSARGCWGALVILRELPDRGSEWFPSNVARNSHACILGFEIRSLELQRLWPISKNDRVKLRATFGGVVTSVTFGPLCQALPLHRPCPFTGCPFIGSAPLHLQGCSSEAGPRRVPPHCCRGQAADAPGSSLASRRPGPASRRSAPQSARPSHGHGLVTKNAQFFHQPLTVSTAWVPRSVSAEWALTRPEDRRAAWKREATFSQFTRFHQALT